MKGWQAKIEEGFMLEEFNIRDFPLHKIFIHWSICSNIVNRRKNNDNHLYEKKIIFLWNNDCCFFDR